MFTLVYLNVQFTDKLKKLWNNNYVSETFPWLDFL